MSSRHFLRSQSRLPVLDMARWYSDPIGFAGQLRGSFHTDGFLQLRHRVPLAVVTRITAEAREFFARDAVQKRAIDYSQSPAFRGFMSLGVENTAGAPDLREQVEIAAEGVLQPSAWPPHERLRGPNQWPPSQPSLRDAVGQYVEHMQRLSSAMTHALALALGLAPTDLDRYFGQPHWQLKLASYQPATASRAPEVGVGAHTDSGFLTCLLQADDSGGLQAFTRGEWVDVPPLGLEYLVINLGEVAEVLSGGFLLATPHRVLSSPSTRLSVPFFHNPSLDALIEPLALPSALAWERDVAYDEQTHWRRPANAMLRDYGLNAFKSLARSHPAVFATHHPDLEVLADGQVVRREAGRPAGAG